MMNIFDVVSREQHRATSSGLWDTSISAIRSPLSRGQPVVGASLGGCAHRIGHEFRQPLALLACDPQAELAAAPEHVISGLRPLVLHEITHLRPREVAPDP